MATSSLQSEPGASRTDTERLRSPVQKVLKLEAVIRTSKGAGAGKVWLDQAKSKCVRNSTFCWGPSRRSPLLVLPRITPSPSVPASESSDHELKPSSQNNARLALTASQRHGRYLCTTGLFTYAIIDNVRKCSKGAKW